MSKPRAFKTIEADASPKPRCVTHVNPLLWHESPSNRYPGKLATVCTVCGGFIGYRDAGKQKESLEP